MTPRSRGHLCLSFALAGALAACDSAADGTAGDTVCADFDGVEACGRATQGGLPCQWYEVQHVDDLVACTTTVVGECLQLQREDSTTGCGALSAYFAEDAEGHVALVGQCTDNPPQGYASCGGAGAPQACACWTDPAPD